MTTRTAARPPWTPWALTVALLAATGLLSLPNRPAGARLPRRVETTMVFVDAAFDVAVLPLVTAGALISARRPGNAIGWIFCPAAPASAFATFATEYGAYGLVTRPGFLPGATVVAWLGQIDLDRLTRELLRVGTRTLPPAHASLRLRNLSERQPLPWGRTT